MRGRLRGNAPLPPPAPPSLSDAAYREWIANNEPGPEELARQRELWAQPTQPGQPAQPGQSVPSYRPLISILTPVYNPDPAVLSAAIASVLAQTYPHWELCLVDGGSSQPDVIAALLAFARQDERIRLELLDENRGISGNSNRALEMARGEFVALLDHDDTLAPFALAALVERINWEPDCDLIYSDHDLLSSDGQRRYQPLFKPDWSPAILLSANYITHLTTIRTGLAREVGGFNPETDGAQDWDLFLRVSERTGRIAHIPHILYHWRDSSASTADNIWAKSYAPPAQLRAITAHLARRGLPEPRAFFDPSGYIRVAWKADRSKLVSIIIPSRGVTKPLQKCIRSIQSATAYPNWEIVIVNNGSQRPEEFPFYRQLSADSRIRVVHWEAPPGTDFNFNAVNNYGAACARGELLLFLNNDIEAITPDWLDELALWSELEDVGVVGAKLLRPTGQIQHAGVIIGLTGFAGHIFGEQPENQWGIFGLAEWYRDYLAVTAACMLLRREVFERIGGFDERFILCGSDVEICLRARAAGLRVIYNPFARLVHLEGATRSNAVPAEDFHTSFPHYHPALTAGDPYFNPNLSYWQLNPTLRQPGEQAPLEFVLDFLQKLPPQLSQMRPQ